MKLPSILSGRRRKRIVLTPYSTPQSLAGWLVRSVLIFGLAIFCLIYGFIYALTAPYLIVPLAIPIAVMFALCIWALPPMQSPPLRTAEFFLGSFVVGLILWPNYLAIALPGLPWITVLRLTGFPMALTLAVCLSGSQTFRAELWSILRTAKWILVLLCFYIVIQVVTLPLSREPFASLQRVFNQQVNWTCVFVLGAYYGSKIGRPTRYLKILLYISIPLMFIALVEYYRHHVLWVGHIPNFLKLDEATGQMYLTSVFRTGNGAYRTKGTYSTPLGLAEYLALLAPFAVYFAIGRFSRALRILGILYLPAAFVIIRDTDARLGVVGYFVCFLVYVILLALLRWRKPGSGLLPAIVVYAYPAVLAVAFVAARFVKPVHTLLFGDAAQAASSETRQQQLHMAIPKFFKNPIGYGAGESGEAMGYGRGEYVTVDNYYISTGLEYGAVGLVTFFGMFVAAIVQSLHHILKPDFDSSDEAGLLVPFTVCFAEFLVIKWVFSQTDNHPIAFLLLGLQVGLMYRIKLREAESVPAPEPIRAAAGRNRRAQRA